MGVTSHRAPRGGDAARVRRATIRHAVAAGIATHPGATVRTLARALHLEDLSVKKALEEADRRSLRRQTDTQRGRMKGLLSAIRRLFARPAPQPQPYTLRHDAIAVGINIHRGGQQEMDMLQDLGTKHARITMWLEEWDQPNRVPAWHAMLRHFDSIGVEPLLVLHMSTRRDWARAAAEFRGRTWQLGNEVDATTINATQYCAMITTAIREMLAADSTAKFVASGLARTDGQGTHDTSDLDRWTAWARALMTLPEGTLRAIAVHAYTDDTLPIVALIVAVNNVVRGRVPLWITEFGPVQHGGPLGIVPDDAAGKIVQAYRYRLPAWGIERCYWYCLNDGCDFAHGLVLENDKKRPGCFAVRKWIRGAA